MSTLKTPFSAALELARAGASVTTDNLVGVGCDRAAAEAFLKGLNSKTRRMLSRLQPGKARPKRKNAPSAARKPWSVTQQVTGRAGSRKGICK